ncbi:MAG: hypothetical protein LW688_04285 [Cryomorphaceae bacterium]|jgi:ATP-dependent DNA ligase|nr:hypothetical protein [Cryomorphaceae bacterium]
MELINSYRKRVTGKYIPVDPATITQKIIESDAYYTSVKYDGHFAVLIVKNKKATLYDRSGNTLNIASITEAATKIGTDAVFAGELCVFKNNTATSHREVNSAIKNPSAYDIRLAVFDLIELNGKEAPLDYADRYVQLCKMIPEGSLFAIEQKTFTSRKDIQDFYAEHEDKEGIVVRSSNGIIYKVKKTITLDMVVLGYGESTGAEEGRMRELLLGLALGNGRYQIVTKCGGGFSDQERISIPKKLSGITVNSEYIEVSGAKTAIIMVKPEQVAEIRCLDLINETTQGAIRKAVLKYDEKKGWLSDTSETTLSILSPNFVRFREDKKADEQDTGTTQAYSLIEPLKEEKKQFSEKPSEIISREVYIKKGKEGTAVRKFIGLRTHKEDSGMYSPFVVVYSDLSLGRKTPLEQELFLCSSEKEVQTKMVELKEEHIKKGWEPAT